MDLADGPPLPGPPAAGARRAARPLLVAAAWVVASLVYASHLYLFHTLRGAETTFSFQVVEALAHFGIWALLTPVVLALARAARGLAWPPRVALHLVLGLAIALVQVVAHALVDQLLLHDGGTTLALLVDRATRFFTRTYYANVLLYLALVAGADLVEAGKRRRARAAELERDLAQARLDALRLQLQPHFLFNALNAVSSLIPRDPAAAQRMVARLGDLLRRVLDEASAGEIPVAREVELARCYLAIEEVRFGDRLRVETAVEPGLEAALVPGLLLQPLLENAVRHGIARRPEGGTVSLAVERAGHRLRLRVRNDGRGLGAGGGRGLGLDNVRGRLARLHPRDHRLDLVESPSGEVEAVVELPLVFAPPGEGEGAGG
jgi:hypothetical protein